MHRSAPVLSLLLAVLLATSGVAAPAALGEREVAALVEIAGAEQQPEGRRALAIRQLENTEVRSHLPLLRRLLREERSLDVRLAAACTLAAHGDLKSPRDLLLATAYDAERTPSCTVGDVLMALARTGEPAGALHLERALKRPAPGDEPFYYHDCCRALAILNTPEARRLLLHAIVDPSPDLRHAAVSALARVALDRTAAESSSAARALHAAARLDRDEKVAEQAASALLWSGVDGPGFFRLLEADPDPVVRARAARVMSRHLLSPARARRLRAALDRERDPAVRAAIEATLREHAGPR